MFFSVIIPSYNASAVLGNNLPALLSYLKGKDMDFEVIIVDDGSQDAADTEAIAGKYNCTYLKNETNLGKGGAVRRGMLAAKGEYRFFTDADIPFEFDAFDRFLHCFEENQADLVIGDRNMVESSYFEKIPLGRRIGSKVFSAIVGGNFDTQCGMKAFRGTVAEEIFKVSRINSFAFDVELLSIALARKYNIRSCYVQIRSQEGSSVNMLRHAFGMLKDITRIKFNCWFKRYRIQS